MPNWHYANLFSLALKLHLREGQGMVELTRLDCL